MVWGQEGLREITFLREIEAGLCCLAEVRLKQMVSAQGTEIDWDLPATPGEGNLFSLQPWDELSRTCSCTESLNASQAVLKLPPFPSCW